MKDKFIILVGDSNSGEWSVAMNTANQIAAQSEYEALKEDGTPVILIFTGDFVTV